MKLVPFPAITPNLELIASTDSFFATVKSRFAEYMASGFFKKAEHEAVFVYQLIAKTGVHHGVVSCTDIADFSSGKVLKHEHTIAAKEQRMMNVMLQNKAMVKPVLLAHDPVVGLEKAIQKVKKGEKFLEIKFEETSDVHTIWKVSDSAAVAKFKKIFANKIPVSYIADGHHRVKTCQLLNESHKSNEVVDTRLQSILTVYFAWDQLSINEFNRCVDAFTTVSPLRFMALISKYCNVKPLKSAKKPRQKHEMTMVISGEWYRLRWKKKVIKAHSNVSVIFDTHLLNKLIFEAILGITDVREDVRLRYIDCMVGVAGLANLVAENHNRVGFCMYPITAEDVKTVAEHGQTLPPKSTWFEPRVKNGLLVKGF